MIKLSGSASGTRTNRRFTFTGNINLHAGSNTISLLSITSGLPVSSQILTYLKQKMNTVMVLMHIRLRLKNIGPHFELYNTGILGPVVLHGLDEGKHDLSRKHWSYEVIRLKHYLN